ncbi:Glycosyltransferase, GT2 family [Pustulibacterium marinum]|uniref:Glycosyltransferase, GT2 family n=1 Tax=Pustulibacterium marinum TaxID=1224947 RepID=A0A1I7IKT2_9FLAO|nr:glycosyltransferase [Pustulibacterium marinum]SFU73547.1 Glycosyltransferase, GT2 family [Pustulibacterium marinum]
MELYFSIVVPIYNRPEEADELLSSLAQQSFQKAFEIVIVEDGSQRTSKEVVLKYKELLNISYYFKPNTGPGDSRNFGMKKAKGNYFIILDSDCIIPSDYLQNVSNYLKENYVPCFGGADTAHDSFTNLQKAISYSMTSFFTTGGIRGSKKAVNKFQPRSFNMGISKEVFEITGGFGKIHPGEDPDLTIRIWNAGFETAFIPNAAVFHKRRISWERFYHQVYKFGLVRPILNSWHPKTKKITYWFPTVFLVSFVFSLFLAVVNFPYFIYGFILYYLLIFVESLSKNKNISIAFLSLVAVTIQFFGYGYAFLKATLKLTLNNKRAEELFPKVFFK